MSCSLHFGGNYGKLLIHQCIQQSAFTRIRLTKNIYKTDFHWIAYKCKPQAISEEIEEVIKFYCRRFEPAMNKKRGQCLSPFVAKGRIELPSASGEYEPESNFFTYQRPNPLPKFCWLKFLFSLHCLLFCLKLLFVAKLSKVWILLSTLSFQVHCVI